MAAVSQSACLLLLPLPLLAKHTFLTMMWKYHWRARSSAREWMTVCLPKPIAIVVVVVASPSWILWNPKWWTDNIGYAVFVLATNTWTHGHGQMDDNVAIEVPQWNPIQRLLWTFPHNRLLWFASRSQHTYSALNCFDISNCCLLAHGLHNLIIIRHTRASTSEYTHPAIDDDSYPHARIHSLA